MDYKKSFYLLWGLNGVGFLFMLAAIPTEQLWAARLGAGCMLAGLLQTMVFFRCPNCGSGWDIRDGIPHYCPRCGAFIR